MSDIQHQLAMQAQLQKSCEQSIAQLVAELLHAGTAFDCALREGAHNIATMSRNGGLEVQVIVKLGTAQEVRDDLWDAIMDRHTIMDRQDYEVSCTQLANAAMERLGFPVPDGGWPK